MSDEITEPLIALKLKRREARRIVAGHPWVFANEIESMLPADSAAGLCRISDDSKRFIGTGYFNKHSLIAARILTRDPGQMIDADMFAQRFASARDRRAQVIPEGDAFRWVFGEADGLPGLVVDQYPGLTVVQVGTRGMEMLQPVWEPVLRDLCGGTPILFRNDSASRKREDLASFVSYPDGEPPDEIHFTEAGAPAVAMPGKGQKTGFFLDQRENRIWVRRLAKSANALDLFCYTGAWGLSMLHGGASKVTFVDQSQVALDSAAAAVERAGAATQSAFFHGDALEFLRNAKAEKQFYDLIVVDPPSFIPNKKSFPPGRKGYVNLYRAAIDLVAPGGCVILCSCSYHLPDNEFGTVVEEAGARSRRAVEYIWRGGAAPDHPQPATFPEAHYLKSAFLRVF